RLADPGVYTGSSFGINYNAQTKTLHDFGVNINIEPGKQYDYFEPRTAGRYFIYENRVNSGIWFSSNYNKIFAFDVNFGGLTYFEDTRDSNEYWFGIEPRIRFNDKLLVRYSFNYNKEFNDRGYATNVGNDIIFGERDRKTIVNSLSGSY